MLCPICGCNLELVDTEVAEELKDKSTGRRYWTSVTADYECPFCEAEFRWIRGRGLIMIEEPFEVPNCGDTPADPVEVQCMRLWK